MFFDYKLRRKQQQKEPKLRNQSKIRQITYDFTYVWDLKNKVNE